MKSSIFDFNFNTSSDLQKDNQSNNDSVVSQEMSTSTFEDLRSFIYKTSGIYFTDSKKYLLEGRILKRLNALNLKSFEEYIKLLQSINGRAELNELFEAITINETYFFRAEQQFDVLEKIIIPEIAESKRNFPKPTIRIWSAASSSGEEAYTISMIIEEKLKLKYPGYNFQVLATDINNAVLESARKGIYREYAVRNVPKNYMDKYFKQNGTNYILSDKIKNNVKFANVNLYDKSAIRIAQGCDIIFCCNVLIYFDNESKEKVVSHLYDTLEKGGYLFIGYSESLHGVNKSFKLVHMPKVMVYKKE